MVGFERSHRRETKKLHKHWSHIHLRVRREDRALKAIHFGSALRHACQTAKPLKKSSPESHVPMSSAYNLVHLSNPARILVSVYIRRNWSTHKALILSSLLPRSPPSTKCLNFLGRKPPVGLESYATELVITSFGRIEHQLEENMSQKGTTPETASNRKCVP